MGLSIGYSLVYMQCCLLQQFCNNPRWRAIARYKSDFFRDVFPQEDQTGTRDGLLVNEITQTLQCMHKMREKSDPPGKGRNPTKVEKK